jgi:outer membrane murein-binding lipoprotein Lpp
MKRTCLLLMTLGLCATPKLMGQDAATEERLNKLGGQIENLMERQTAQHKQMEALSKEVETARDAAARPNTSYASQEDLKRLAESRKWTENAWRTSKRFARSCSTSPSC